MLQTISWPHFLLGLVYLAGLYWLFILIVYYRKEIRQLTKGQPKNQSNISKNEVSNVFQGTEEPEAIQPQLLTHEELSLSENEAIQANGTLFQLMYLLLNEIKKTLQEAAEKKLIREELLLTLQILLSKEVYMPMKRKPFQFSVNNFIQMQCQEICKVIISEDELPNLWHR